MLVLMLFTDHVPIRARVKPSFLRKGQNERERLVRDVLFMVAPRGILAARRRIRIALSWAAPERRLSLRRRLSIFLHKSHNVSILLYHLVCPAKYRRVVISEKVDMVIVESCKEIARRYEMHFLEIWTDRDHAHFLIQSVPTYAPTKIARVVSG